MHSENGERTYQEALATEKVFSERKVFFFDLMENARGRFLKLTEDVGGEKYCRTTLVFFPDQVEEVLLHKWVQPCCRFIQHDQLRRVQQPLNDANLLFIAIGEIIDASLQVQLHQI